MSEPEGGHRELDRHGRDVGRRRVWLERLAAVPEDVVDDAPGTDTREVVGLEHPLVVLGDDRPGPREALASRHRVGQAIDDPVVEPDHRQMRLGDRQILVVPRIRDDRLALLGLRAAGAPGKVEAGLGGDAFGRLRPSHPHVHAVGLVERRRIRILRPRPIERIEVEARRAPLKELRRGDGVAQGDAGPVEGQVVVRELTEVREARRDLGRATATCGHCPAEPLEGRIGELVTPALRPHAREAKRRRLGFDSCRQGAPPSPHALGEKSLAEDEEALGTMRFHDALLSSNAVERASPGRGHLGPSWRESLTRRVSSQASAG